MAANSDTPAPEFNFLEAMLTAIKEGTVDRSAVNDITALAGVDPKTGVHSKDVIIPLETAESFSKELPRNATVGEKKRHPATDVPISEVKVRLYRPGNATPGKKLPLVIYFHGGGFAFNSASTAVYQKHLNILVAEAEVVAVSVDYRLAPEHPLPAAYIDSWVALKWATSRSYEHEWIENYADLDRVFLGGDSAGGNIAHHMAIWVGLAKRDGINLIGVFLNSPYFFYNDPEDAQDPELDGFGEKCWNLVCPGTVGYKEDLRFNPGMDPILFAFGCTRKRVYTGEYDFVREGCLSYMDDVSKSGWRGRIELLDFKGEAHVFSVSDPESESGSFMIENVASFINNYTPLPNSIFS